MTLGRLAIALVVIGIGVLFVFPADAHAWTHGTHLYVAESVLANLELLPPAIADLLRAFPYDFLYGNIAPDASLVKHIVPEGRHSHAWNVGQETYDFADLDARRAFGLGFLSHLAADTVAHNYFVPRQLMLTSSTRSMGHSYWEIRAETHLTDRYAGKARDLIRLDHTETDRYLEKIISPTLFSVSTNRKLFRGMVHLTQTKAWQRAMQATRDRSRWLLEDQYVERHLALAYDLTMNLLAEAGRRGGQARELDPSGKASLARVKALRRKIFFHGNLLEPPKLEAIADETFGLPPINLGFWSDSKVERPWLGSAAESQQQFLPIEQRKSVYGQG
jgi:Zinc dependent phospholipase C